MSYHIHIVNAGLVPGSIGGVPLGTFTASVLQPF